MAFRRIKAKLTELKNRWINYWKDEKRGVNVKDNLKFILAYSIIGYLTFFALLSLLKKDLIANGQILYIIAIALGFGCAYYLLIDFLKFIKDTFRKEK
jgi:hypothetical protein